MAGLCSRPKEGKEMGGMEYLRELEREASDLACSTVGGCVWVFIKEMVLLRLLKIVSEVSCIVAGRMCVCVWGDVKNFWAFPICLCKPGCLKTISDSCLCLPCQAPWEGDSSILALTHTHLL